MASRTEVADTHVFNSLHSRRMKMQVLETVPADNFAIQADFPPCLIFTPAGAIDVLMPAVTADLRGMMFFISNVGAGGVITLKTSADAAFSPAITISAGASAIVICTGTTWRELVAGAVVA